MGAGAAPRVGDGTDWGVNPSAMRFARGFDTVIRDAAGRGDREGDCVRRRCAAHRRARAICPRRAG
jgi:hypothetical protein